jgi:hypothetical protein
VTLPSDDLTVSDLLAYKVDSLSCLCRRCGHTWPALIEMLPDATTLTTVRTLMQCPSCTSGTIEVEPDWPGGEPQPN